MSREQKKIAATASSEQRSAPTQFQSRDARPSESGEEAAASKTRARTFCFCAPRARAHEQEKRDQTRRESGWIHRAKEAGIAIDRACRQEARRSATIKSARRRKTQCAQRGWVAATRSRLRRLDPEKRRHTGPMDLALEARNESPARREHVVGATRKNGSPGSRIACLAAAITRRRPHARLDR
ncbi:hypothetical protein MRX96_009679 [Rhipicephalus microplus]